MNTLIAIIHSIKVALFGAWGHAVTTRPHPKKAKLAARNGYGNDDVPPKP